VINRTLVTDGSPKANNELSGPVVTAFLLKWLALMPNRRLTYRAVIVPETIGSIAFLSKRLEHLKQNVIAGYNVTCVGDEKNYSFLPSRNGLTLADKVARHVLYHMIGKYREYRFLDRGSDERQYCSPGVDLPVASIMRSKYGEYPEYHTSLDNFDLVTAEGLGGSLDILTKCIEVLEFNPRPRMTVLCEPQLGKRNLYPTISLKGSAAETRDMMNLIAYSDGRVDLLTIAETIGIPVWELQKICKKLVNSGIMICEPS